MPSPVVLFVYNRPFHTSKTIEALSNNLLASQTSLYVYSDYYKDKKSKNEVLETRSILKNINGFKSVKVIEREENYGLAKSITLGVGEVLNKYSTVIVLEDDIVTSPYFLTFMNNALEFYQNEKKIWHISGWNYPIKSHDNQNYFFWRTMNCWGWATWKDRWEKFEKNPKELIDTFTENDIAKFNLDNSENFWSQVEKNATGELNTWAVFWYATIFKNNGLCLNPIQSYVLNIGLDNSGENCGLDDGFTTKSLNNSIFEFETKTLLEDERILHKVKRFYNRKSSYLYRILSKFKKFRI